MSENEIRDRLTKLEVQVVEKWASHDKRSDERWADLMEQFHDMKNKLTNRPCVEHEKLMLGFNSRILALEKWLSIAGWSIGVVYVAIVGSLVKHMIGH